MHPRDGHVHVLAVVHHGYDDVGVVARLPDQEAACKRHSEVMCSCAYVCDSDMQQNIGIEVKLCNTHVTFKIDQIMTHTVLLSGQCQSGLSFGSVQIPVEPRTRQPTGMIDVTMDIVRRCERRRKGSHQQPSVASHTAQRAASCACGPVADWQGRLHSPCVMMHAHRRRRLQQDLVR